MRSHYTLASDDALIALAPSGLPSKAEAADALPDNAIAGRYEGGWECMAGFQRTVDRCARVVVPANAYLDALNKFI